MARTKSDQEPFVEYVLEQLKGIGPVRAKRMFGGCGLYFGEIFFAIIHESLLYFKVGDQTRRRYEQTGSEVFEPTPGQRLKTYYEVPAEVLDDRTALVSWAEDAIEAARLAKAGAKK